MKLVLSCQMLDRKKLLRHLDDAWNVVLLVIPHINDESHGGPTLKGEVAEKTVNLYYDVLFYTFIILFLVMTYYIVEHNAVVLFPNLWLALS